MNHRVHAVHCDSGPDLRTLCGLSASRQGYAYFSQGPTSRPVWARSTNNITCKRCLAQRTRNQNTLTGGEIA